MEVDEQVPPEVQQWLTDLRSGKLPNVAGVLMARCVTPGDEEYVVAWYVDEDKKCIAGEVLPSARLRGRCDALLDAMVSLDGEDGHPVLARMKEANAMMDTANECMSRALRKLFWSMPIGLVISVVAGWMVGGQL